MSFAKRIAGGLLVVGMGRVVSAEPPPSLDRPSPPPCCADGKCIANPLTYGWYATRWRHWPLECPTEIAGPQTGAGAAVAGAKRDQGVRNSACGARRPQGAAANCAAGRGNSNSARARRTRYAASAGRPARTKHSDRAWIWDQDVAHISVPFDGAVFTARYVGSQYATWNAATCEPIASQSGATNIAPVSGQSIERLGSATVAAVWAASGSAERAGPPGEPADDGSDFRSAG